MLHPISFREPWHSAEARQDELIAAWDAATRLVMPDVYKAYCLDGDTRGFKALKALDYAFDRVLREIKETVVEGDAPAVWSVYNMGYIVKTRESLFSIDLKHRRAHGLVPLLDLLHTGDCGVANDKLRVEWGHPDLWLLFPMTSLDVTDAFKRICPKRCAFGHIWELSHAVGKGRAIERHIRRGLDMAARAGGDPVVAFWGDRIC